MINLLILILIALISVFFAALFSGAETGIYRISWLRLRLGVQKKILAYKILSKTVTDKTAFLMTMLIGTNLCNYIATFLVTIFFMKTLHVSQSPELFVTITMAPFLFIFSELIPKNIFFHRSDSLMLFFAPMLLIFKKLFTFTGLIPMLNFLSSIFTHLTSSAALKTTSTSVKPSHIKAIIQETHDEGLITPTQSRMIHSIEEIFATNLRSVLTPFGRVDSVNINTSRSELLAILKKTSHSRLLVWKSYPENIIGFINVYETLSTKNDFTRLDDFVEPIMTLHISTNVIEAIRFMQKNQIKIVLVSGKSKFHRQKPTGLITMKDLAEEIIGEVAEW